MTDFQPRPGQRVEGYDVTRRRRTDYYAVFGDIPAADREVCERAQAYVDEGMTMRRIRPRAKGSASRILKRSSHITVVVEPNSNKEA